MVQQSVATLRAPEFINLKPSDISPLMAECEIKAFYLGQNRNGSEIDKEVATEMGRTLRGAPIVGWYKQDKEDFRDHGEIVTIDGDGVHFNVMTKPYGFVSPDAQVWFQEFEETDAEGNKVLRTYLMTTGYLWIEQFPEAKSIIENGKGHSMELDKNSVKGHWSLDLNSNREFFIINDAIISKLCVLGDDVEPCFEGSMVSAPNISKQFSLEHDKQVKTTLYTMMEELRKTLQGGKTVETQDTKVVETEFSAETQDNAVENAATESEETKEVAVENSFEKTEEVAGNETSNTESNSNESVTFTEDKPEASEETEFAKKEEDEKEKAAESEEEKGDSKASDDKEEEEDETKKKFSALQAEYEELKAKYTELNGKYGELTTLYSALKEDNDARQLKDKQNLIAEFTQLTDEDKADVVAHINEYSLDEIKSKLAVIGFEKGVNFSAKSELETEVMTVDVNTNFAADRPEWLDAVEAIESK